MRHSSSTKPGGTVTYAIWVWSTVLAKNVTVSASSSARSMKFPHFTLCPSAHGTTCTIHRLPANQAFELTVTDQVRHAATGGAAITLSVTADSSPLSPASASVATVVSKKTPTTTAPVVGGGGSIPPLPPTTLEPIPSATISPPGLGGLFPTVTPKASPSGSADSRRRQAGKVTRVAQTSSALPLDPRLIGGQLAGLAVLAAAITMVVARLSLRTPQPAAPGPSGPAAPAGGAAGSAEPAEPAKAEDETGEAESDQQES